MKKRIKIRVNGDKTSLKPNYIPPTSIRKNIKLSWENHEGHRDTLKEFYHLNKYYMTKQLKDTLLDAIECMNYVINEETDEIK